MTAESLIAWVESGAWTPIAGRIGAALIIVILAFAVARLVTITLQRLRSRSRSGAQSIYIVEKLTSYAVILAGGFIGLSTLGVNLTSLTVFAGAVGVGVGLGLQGIVREFVSGLVIIFDPLVHVGDYVEIESGMRGEILEVGPRATRLLTNDGLDVVIPNSKLIDGEVVNWTLKGQTRRLHVPFGVAYGVDKAKVRDAVLAAAHKVPFTLPDTDTRRTQVWLIGFGDSSLNFELVVWPSFEAVKRPASAHAAYTWAIEDALREAGIEIPFPQVDLRVRSLFGREGEAAARSMGLKVQAAEDAAPKAKSTNDAAEDLLREAAAEAAKPQAGQSGGGEPEGA
ncbi:mechanosensitive ion channel family protein [Phenylobacterium sp.]|uniref:mechanosensitive ion channel family protein n=1 Tax=Phenylobacterium sp. TaxID=1871053 RepID=UPI0035AED95A